MDYFFYKGIFDFFLQFWFNFDIRIDLFSLFRIFVRNLFRRLLKN